MKRNIYALLALLLFVISTGFKKELSYKQNYIDNYCVLAIQEMYKSGIPASITLGQAVIESSFGTSELAIKANNHFGIKCKSYWTGNTYYYEDDDYRNGQLIASCFRSYSTSIKSFKDHTRFLSNSERYQPLFRYGTQDYKSWAYGLEKAGYATDPQYAEKLIKAIEKYHLHRFDKIDLKDYK